MDDLISRQAAIDELKRISFFHWFECGEYLSEDTREIEIINSNKAFEAIEALPSAQSGWIPCSEGMPEEHEWIGTKKFGTTISNEVYVTFETPDGERFTRHISFQNGKLSAVDEQHMKVWYKGAKPIAWMPIPEPYKGEQKGEKNEQM